MDGQGVFYEEIDGINGIELHSSKGYFKEGLKNSKCETKVIRCPFTEEIEALDC